MMPTYTGKNLESPTGFSGQSNPPSKYCTLCQKKIEDDEGTAKIIFNADPFWNVERSEHDLCAECAKRLAVRLITMRYESLSKNGQERM